MMTFAAKIPDDTGIFVDAYGLHNFNVELIGSHDEALMFLRVIHRHNNAVYTSFPTLYGEQSGTIQVSGCRSDVNNMLHWLDNLYSPL